MCSLEKILNIYVYVYTCMPEKLGVLIPSQLLSPTHPAGIQYILNFN